MRLGALVIVVGLLAGCTTVHRAKMPLPVDLIPAAGSRTEAHEPKRLVIVLPGMGDTMDVLRESGIVEAIQRNLPATDVALVPLAMPVYFKGRAARRLREEIVIPARAGGYEEIFLAGASLGALGVLDYERAYPNEMRGLILMAPFMGTGGGALLREIRESGGLSKWKPGASALLGRSTSAREQWRVVKTWIATPERTRNIWLICGQEDRFQPIAELIAPLVPAENYFSPRGGHSWAVWSEGAARAFAAIENSAG